ncbi:MAG: MlaD family protein [Chloroherpetonaceae bacterium]|nr:MlaD family protein [Chloroherpetonaceae bacterium]
MDFSLSKELKVGLTVLSAAVILIYVIWWGKDVKVGTRQVQFSFRNVSGLQIGDPVMVSGLRVGKVESISFSESLVIVSASLPPELELFKDAEVKLMMYELMTGKKLELIPGTREWGFLEEGKMIPGYFVSDIPELVGFAGTTVDTLRLLLSDMQRTLSNANRILGDDDMANDLRLTLRNMRQITTDLAYVSRDMRSVKVSELMGRLESTVNSADSFMRELKPEVKSSLEEFRTTARNINEAILVIKPVVEEIKSNRKSVIGKLMYDTLFASRLESAIVQLDSVLKLGQDDGIKVKLKVF